MPEEMPDLLNVARLNRVGRLQFELEQYIFRCRKAERAPSLKELETLLRVAGIEGEAEEVDL